MISYITPLSSLSPVPSKDTLDNSKESTEVPPSVLDERCYCDQIKMLVEHRCKEKGQLTSRGIGNHHTNTLSNKESSLATYF